MSKDNTLLKHDNTDAAKQAGQSMLDQSSPNFMEPNHLWRDWAKAPLPTPL